jgi:hypothetical protein
MRILGWSGALMLLLVGLTGCSKPADEAGTTGSGDSSATRGTVPPAPETIQIGFAKPPSQYFSKDVSTISGTMSGTSELVTEYILDSYTEGISKWHTVQKSFTGTSKDDLFASFLTRMKGDDGKINRYEYDTQKNVSEGSDTLAHYISYSFPTHSIKVGDTWSGSVINGQSEAEIRFKLVGIEEFEGRKVAKIDYDYNLTYPNNGIDTTEKFTATEWIDIENGMTWKRDYKGTSQGAGSLEFEGSNVSSLTMP